MYISKIRRAGCIEWVLGVYPMPSFRFEVSEFLGIIFWVGFIGNTFIVFGKLFIIVYELFIVLVMLGDSFWVV